MGKTETATVDVIINGQKANATLNEMRATVRQLNAEMGKIPDPLNSSEFKKGQQALDDLKGKIKDITGQAKTTGDAWMNMLGVAGGFTLAGLATKGLDLIKTGLTDMVESTKAVSDSLKLTFAGVKEGYDSLMRSFATGDWNNLISNFQNAVSAGREYQEVLNNLGHRTMAEAILSAEDQLAFQTLWNNFNTTGRLMKDRIADGNAAIEIENKAVQRRAENNRILEDMELKRLARQTGLGEVTIRNFIKEYQQNQQLIDTTREYLKLQKDVDAWGEATADPNSKLKSYPQFIKDFVVVIKDMDKTNDKSLKAFADAWVARINTETQGQIEIKKLHKQVDQEQDSENKKNLTEAGNEVKKQAEYLKNIQKELEDAKIQIIQDEHEKELKLNELDIKRKLDKIKGNSKIENDLRETLLLESKEKEREINQKYDDKAKSDAWTIEKAKWEAIIQADDKGSAEWFKDENQWLDKQADYELSNTKLTEQERLDIKAKYLALIKKLEEEFPSSKPGKGFGKDDLKENTPGAMLKTSDKEVTNDYTFNFKERRDLLDKERDAELEIAGGNAEKQKKIWVDYYKSVDELNNEHVKALANLAQTVVNALSGALSAWTNYQNAIIQKDEDANNIQKDNLKKRLDSGVINQKTYDAETAALDAKLNKEKRKAAHDTAVINRDISIANAIINTAVAATSALSAGPIIGEFLMALVILLGGLEIALIASTPIPAAAKGRYNVIGQGDGKQYNNVPYEKAPETGLYTRPTLFAETGNEIIIDPVTTKNIQMNYPGIISAINFARIPQRAMGNFIQTNLSQNPIQQNNIQDKINERLADALEQFNYMAKKGINANISYDIMIQEQDKMERIQRDVSK